SRQFSTMTPSRPRTPAMTSASQPGDAGDAPSPPDVVAEATSLCGVVEAVEWVVFSAADVVVDELSCVPDPGVGDESTPGSPLVEAHPDASSTDIIPATTRRCLIALPPHSVYIAQHPSAPTVATRST
ncbi:MAG: hypothetical protein WA903_11500, partial [Ornithinimicrobium sp.]